YRAVQPGATGGRDAGPRATTGPSSAFHAVHGGWIADGQGSGPVSAVPGSAPGAGAADDGIDPGPGRRGGPPRRDRLAYPGIGKEPDDGVPGTGDADSPRPGPVQGGGGDRPDRSPAPAFEYGGADRGIRTDWNQCGEGKGTAVHAG